MPLYIGKTDDSLDKIRNLPKSSAKRRAYERKCKKIVKKSMDRFYKDFDKVMARLERLSNTK